MFVILVLIITLLFPAASVVAATDLNSTFRFLNIPSSARAAALGGATVALPDADVSHFQMNPAYLNENNHSFFGLTYLNHLADVNMGFANGAWHLNGIGTLGVGMRFVGYGELVGTDADGNEIGTFQPFDLALSSALGWSIEENLQVGVGVHLIHSSYDIYKSTAIALSAGLLYHINEQTSAGLSIQNLGRQLSTFNDLQESLPLDIRIGITRRLEHLPLRLSLTAHSLNRWEMPVFYDDAPPDVIDNIMRRLILGGEFLLSENVVFRLGYNHYLHEEMKTASRIALAGASIGLGISIRRFTFDVSRNSYSDIGSLTQLGVGFQL